MRASEAYRGAAKFAGGVDELQAALMDLKSEIESWSTSKCDYYRKKSQEWHLRNYGTG